MEARTAQAAAQPPDEPLPSPDPTRTMEEAVATVEETLGGTVVSETVTHYGAGPDGEDITLDARTGVIVTE